MDKIHKIQQEIGALVKDKLNPFFKSNYTDINQIIEQLLPLLEKYGITVVQPLEIDVNGNALTTKVYDGDTLLLSSSIVLPHTAKPQELGSAITYYRRYSLQSLFLLRAEDDDANSASKTVKKQDTSSDLPF